MELLKKIYIKIIQRIFPKSFHRILSGPLKNKLWSLSISDSRYLLGKYEMETAKLFLKNIQQGSVVYDIGANAGYFSLLSSYLLNNSGKVFAFEPLPENIDILFNHIKRNNCADIEVCKMALSDTIGDVVFSDSGNASANTIIENSSLFVNSANKISINSITLDYFVFNLNNLPPSILKIDVEGAEYKVLLGSKEVIAKYKPKIILATHDCHIDGVSELCLSFLKSLNYEFEKIVDFKEIDGQADFICSYCSD